MKTLIVIMGLFLLQGFGNNQELESVEGLWTGAYRNDEKKESVVVKFEGDNVIELYCGDVEEEKKCKGTYRLQGDTLLIFKYTTADGKQYTMQGSINKRKTYVDGFWETEDKTTGSFYLRKEKIQELFIQP